MRRSLNVVGTPDRDQIIATIAAQAAELVAETRRERARRHAAGDDTAWLDQVLTELEPLAAQIHDLDTVRAIRAVIDRHGGGPYPADELAAIAGIPIADARRVLDQLVEEGLATRHRSDPPSMS
jgi:predicted Rossmann fold nucleotide-binding protein DprA/Smf involved in DNA uptake